MRSRIQALFVLLLLCITVNVLFRRQLFEGPTCDRVWSYHDLNTLLHGDPYHPCMQTILRQRYLIAPSNLEYNLTSDKGTQTSFSKFQEDIVVDTLSGKKREKFFVDCGSGDGEQWSNTLFLERARSWTGLLIEANPHVYDHLLAKQRNSYIINACAAPKESPGRMEFAAPPDLSRGGLVAWLDPHQKEELKNTFVHQRFSVQCFPLISLLNALDRKHVDYLSVDVSGAELGILGSLSFDKVSISIISVRFSVHDSSGALDHDLTQRKLQAIRALLVWKTGLYAEKKLLPEGAPQVAIYKKIRGK